MNVAGVVLVPQQPPERGWVQLPALPDGASLGTA